MLTVPVFPLRVLILKKVSVTGWMCVALHALVCDSGFGDLGVVSEAAEVVLTLKEIKGGSWSGDGKAGCAQQESGSEVHGENDADADADAKRCLRFCNCFGPSRLEGRGRV